MRAMLYVLVAGAALAPLLTHHRPASSLEAKLAAQADAMSTVLPKPLEDGMTLSSVTAEGKTLTFTVTGAQDWRPGFSNEEMTRVVGRMWCRQGIGDVIARGGQVRFAWTDRTGAALPTLVVDRCPSAN